MLDGDKFWESVQKRDNTFNGKFYYGVITTGIFCNPGCKTRLALRKNVRFFLTSQEAESAGFRACKKCNPKNSKLQIQDVIHELCRYIELNLAEVITLKEISKKSGYSAAHIQKAFITNIGVSPKAYQDGLRQKNFKNQLKTQTNVSKAIYQSGYSSTSRVYEKLGKNIGMTPNQYRKGGEEVLIFYGCATTSLGPTLIGATDKGICFLQFGEDKDALLVELHREFPNAKIVSMPKASRSEFDNWMLALNDYLGNKKKLASLPLDIRGTAFQLLVWRYLQTIPAGDVRSYTQVAQAIGKPRGVRAVASACARNNVGLLIPCHRVIRGDGGLAGYRWGIDHKRNLLEIESRK